MAPLWQQTIGLFKLTWRYIFSIVLDTKSFDLIYDLVHVNLGYMIMSWRLGGPGI